MTTEIASPAAGQTAEVSGQQQPGALESLAQATEGSDAGGATQEGETAPKKEKTPEQREIDRLRRAVDKRTRQLYEMRAQSQTPQGASTREPAGGTNPPSQGNDEKLTLSRAELDKLVKEGAERMAPSIRQQQTEMEHRAEVVRGLAKDWGTEKFDQLSSDLDDAFGGLEVRKGQPKPAVEAIFESENPKAVIEYLADPDNADEAEALSQMGDRQAGRAIAKLDAKLAAAKTDKPQRSNAAAPIEPLKGAGKASTNMPDPANTKAYMKWANEQERRR